MSVLGKFINWFNYYIRQAKSAWRTMDGGWWHCTGGSDQDHPQEKEMQKVKMVVWGGLTNSCEKKRSERKGGKGKIYLYEFRVPKKSTKR